MQKIYIYIKKRNCFQKRVSISRMTGGKGGVNMYILLVIMYYVLIFMIGADRSSSAAIDMFLYCVYRITPCANE